MRPEAAARQPCFMLVAHDEKVAWDREGRIHFLPPGRDSVSIFDIGTDPARPAEIAFLPLGNSLFGPPTNPAVTPDGMLAVLRIVDDRLVDTGTRIALRGHPAAMRSQSP